MFLHWSGEMIDLKRANKYHGDNPVLSTKSILRKMAVHSSTADFLHVWYTTDSVVSTGETNGLWVSSLENMFSGCMAKSESEPTA